MCAYLSRINMNQDNFFIYAMNSRVLWISKNIFYIPVLSDLYSVHLLKNDLKIDLDACINYSVKYFNKFLQDELVLSPINEQDRQEVLISYEKIKVYIQLSEYVNYSYLSALPPVFNSESDKLEMLSQSLLNKNLIDCSVNEKHADFVSNLLKDKKVELKNRFIKIVHQLKKAKTLKEVQEIGYEVVYPEINVV